MDAPYQQALATLFWEVFEGVQPGADGTWFVQGKEALLDACRSLTPQQASKVIPGARATIGAHVRHLAYYLSLFNANVRKETVTPDWEGSWAVQSFDDQAWQQLCASVKHEFAEAMKWYEASPTDLDEEMSTYAIANLAHAAFHLGAIRALMPQAE